MKFRPCIDIHNGAVKQIVGGSLKDAGNAACLYTHLRAHETGRKLVCRLLLEKKKQNPQDLTRDLMPSSALKIKKIQV